MRSRPDIPIEEFYALKFRPVLAHLRHEHFSFWMACAYLFFEYVRPQSIIPVLDVLPWSKICVALSLIGWMLDARSRWVRDPANIYMTLLLIAILLANTFAKYPAFAWEHVDFVNWYIIYFLIINVVNTEKRLLIFLGIFLLSSFKLSLFGARTFAMRGFAFTSWGIQGPPGFFENSGELAIQMLMFSPLAYELANFVRPYASWTKHKILVLFPITGVMTVIGTSSRGGQLGMAYQLYRSLLKGRMSIKAVLVAGAIGAVAWTLIPEEQKERFSAAGGDQTSLQRILYWRHGLEIIRDHPVLGIGGNNFGPYFGAHWPEDLLRGGKLARGVLVSEAPHNIFIQLATDSGLVGLSLFLLLAWRTARIGREVLKLSLENAGINKPFPSIAKGLVVAMWGFLIAGQFVTVTYYPFFWINLALMVALGNIARSQWTLSRSQQFPQRVASQM